MEAKQKETINVAIYTIDACAGTGMLGLGIHCAMGFSDVRTICYVEQDSRATANLVARMEDSTLDQAPVWDDVKTMCDPEFIEYVQQFRPLVLCAGYPCQPFSEVGKRRGTDDPRHLWPWLFRFIEKAQPECVFFENVAGHLSMGLGSVLRDLEGAGYKTAVGLFTATEVGARHKRQRMFIVGYLADPTCKRLEGWHKSSNTIRREIESGYVTEHGDILFAPGPAEYGAWARTIELDPSLKPSLCRVADGVDSGTNADRLRLIGNGVVPLQAAYAFVSLAACLEYEK